MMPVVFLCCGRYMWSAKRERGHLDTEDGAGEEYLNFSLMPEVLPLICAVKKDVLPVLQTRADTGWVPSLRGRTGCLVENRTSTRRCGYSRPVPGSGWSHFPDKNKNATPLGHRDEGRGTAIVRSWCTPRT